MEEEEPARSLADGQAKTFRYLRDKHVIMAGHFKLTKSALRSRSGN